MLSDIVMCLLLNPNTSTYRGDTDTVTFVLHSWCHLTTMLNNSPDERRLFRAQNSVMLKAFSQKRCFDFIYM